MIITGDPFVDAGGAAYEELTNLFPHKNTIELIEMVAGWFICNWNGKIDSLQLNSNITHNSKRGSKSKQEKALKDLLFFFTDLLEEGENSINNGFCRICGAEGKLFGAGRDIYPLSGSNAFVNYHHFHEKGLLLCNQCILKLFFLPLAVIQTGGKISLLQLQNSNTVKYWVEKTIRVNFNNISKGISEGLLKSDFSNPKNALFDMAMDMIINFDLENEYLQLYHFTNFGANPDCEIYNLPDPVFRYLTKVLKSSKSDWYKFLRRYYKIKKATWDDTAFQWKNKKEDTVINSGEYKNNYNEVIEKLLANKTLIPTFRRFYKENFSKGNHVNILLLNYYLKEVKNMDSQQLDIIKRLGNAIMDIARKDSSNFKKYLTMIESASKAHQLRTIIISLIKKHYSNGEEKPLLTVDEYINYLFPDGVYWSEIRDILLIYLYQLLHEENIREISLEDDIMDNSDKEELKQF